MGINSIIIAEVKELLKLSKIIDAFQLVEDNISKHSKVYDELIQIIQRYNSIVDQNQKGLISKNDFDIKQNQIVRYFIFYVNSLKKSSDNENLESLIYSASKNLKLNFELSYYKNHSRVVRENGSRNIWDFMVLLMAEIQDLIEKDKYRQEEVIQANIVNPDFMKILERAIEISSRSRSTMQKRLLAKVIKDRMTSFSDTFESILQARCIEAVKSMTNDQLLILKYLSKISFIEHSKDNEELAKKNIIEYISYLLVFFEDIPSRIDWDDILYLEELNLVREDEALVICELRTALFPRSVHEKHKREIRQFFESKIGGKLESNWYYIKKYLLSSTGKYLGNVLLKIDEY